MFGFKIRLSGFIVAALATVIILTFAFHAGKASAATIVISGTNPVAERTVQVPGCTKLTTTSNNQKATLYVICEHVYASPPLGDPATTQAPTVKVVPAEPAKK